MIAAWMTYTLCVGTLVAAAAWVTERIARGARAPTRFVWVFAIVATLAWPIVAQISNGAKDPQQLRTTDSAKTLITLDPTLIRVVEPIAERAASLDPLLLWIWLAASTVGLGLLMWTDRRTRRLIQRLPTRVIHGVPVRLSNELGPAVVGWPTGSIVLPRWTEELADEERHLIIAHESHHQRARDSLLIGASAFAVTLAPWNLPIWWMARRLRAAIEVDCDARVLRDGTAPAAYAALLCAVAGRPRSPLRAAVAISHPTSLLARRIDHMLQPIVRAHPAKLALTGLVVGGIIVAACEVPTPPDQDPTSSYKTQADDPLFIVEEQSPNDAKRELAREEAKLQELLRSMERLAARGANDPSSELHREFQALEIRVRESRTRLETLARGTYKLMRDSSVSRRTLDRVTLTEQRRTEAERRLTAELRDTETAKRAVGSIMRLREVGSTRATDGANEQELSFGYTEGEPLIYVDDVLVAHLDNLSPRDIESIEVLKGPAASRIVGAEAAGGVIKITTKTRSN